MRLAIISAALGVACAFTPSSKTTSTAGLRMSDPEAPNPEKVDETPVGTPPPKEPPVQPINGWVPDSSKPLYGLPGASAPLGFYDPVGFSDREPEGVERDLEGVKRLREAEVMHSRVSMMAVVGYIIGESTPTITYGFQIPHTIANNQIPEVPGTVLFSFFLIINLCEAYRAARGWVEPTPETLFTLRENYYPGDLGFDPLGLKPSDPKEFEDMQTKELNNGRLAMIAVAGFCAQEQVNGQGILENLGY